MCQNVRLSVRISNVVLSISIWSTRCNMINQLTKSCRRFYLKRLCKYDWSVIMDIMDIKGLTPSFWNINLEKSTSTNWILTACLACKNNFRNWFLQAKTSVCQTRFLHLDFSKSNYRSTGGEYMMANLLFRLQVVIENTIEKCQFD